MTACVLPADLVIKEPNLEDVLHVLNSIRHVQIPQRVSQQQHVWPRVQLLEVAAVEQRAFPFIVDVDQLSFESPQHSLCQHMESNEYLKPCCGGQTAVCGVATHTLIKVHVIGDDVDVGMENPSLADHLFQDVSYPSREDEQGDAVLMQVVKEELVVLPV